MQTNCVQLITNRSNSSRPRSRRPALSRIARIAAKKTRVESPPSNMEYCSILLPRLLILPPIGGCLPCIDRSGPALRTPTPENVGWRKQPLSAAGLCVPSAGIARAVRSSAPRIRTPLRARRDLRGLSKEKCNLPNELPNRLGHVGRPAQSPDRKHCGKNMSPPRTTVAHMLCTVKLHVKLNVKFHSCFFSPPS